MPTIPEPWNRIRGNGFSWYESGQKHILTRVVFRNCGYRSAQYQQYDTSIDRGCGDSSSSGCHGSSTVFGFLTYSNQFTPELMQGTRNVSFESCGRRFSLDNWIGNIDTVSGRIQNWLDADGSASGFGRPTFIVSGVESVFEWWNVDDTGG